jgi:hypothetical protein
VVATRAWILSEVSMTERVILKVAVQTPAFRRIQSSNHGPDFVIIVGVDILRGSATNRRLKIAWWVSSSSHTDTKSWFDTSGVRLVTSDIGVCRPQVARWEHPMCYEAHNVMTNLESIMYSGLSWWRPATTSARAAAQTRSECISQSVAIL